VEAEPPLEDQVPVFFAPLSTALSSVLLGSGLIVAKEEPPPEMDTQKTFSEAEAVYSKI